MSKKERLQLLQTRYKQLVGSLSKIGFIWHGNLQRRMLTCKNPKCRCTTSGKPQHGPYPYWTTKVSQKTITKLLTTEEADLYESWIQNRRQLEATIKEMNQISKKAALLVLKDRKNTF